MLILQALGGGGGENPSCLLQLLLVPGVLGPGPLVPSDCLLQLHHSGYCPHLAASSSLYVFFSVSYKDT